MTFGSWSVQRGLAQENPITDTFLLYRMALEAMYQKHCVLHPEETKDVTGPEDLAYRFRNVKFERAIVVEEGKRTNMLLTLTSVPGSKDWHEFRVRTAAGEKQDVIYEHCAGLIRVQEPLGQDHSLGEAQLTPLRHPQSASPWYKLQQEMGSHFGKYPQEQKPPEVII